jgi:hypothetical protein
MRKKCRTEAGMWIEKQKEWGVVENEDMEELFPWTDQTCAALKFMTR